MNCSFRPTDYAIRRASSLVSSLAAERGPDLWPALLSLIMKQVGVVIDQGGGCWAYGRKTMNRFSRTTSIAGMQVSNWILVIVAVVVLWIIYSAFIAH